MTTISARIIADSVALSGKRITTMQLRYPRFIHAEFMTHRVFSRNASSSRAVPISRLIQDIIDDPVVPLHWGKNQKGMQAREENDAPVKLYGQKSLGDSPNDHSFTTKEKAWEIAMRHAIELARAFDEAGYHKQTVNRLLEPFSHINVVVTATEWDNFYALRRHADAEPHIKMLADAMWEAQQASEPDPLEPEEWHLPYIKPSDRKTLRPLPYEARNMQVMGSEVVGFAPATRPPADLIKISVARCARVSYLTHDGKPTTAESDLKLYQDLVGGEVIHASPAEHQATPDIFSDSEYAGEFSWRAPQYHGNLKGWIQYRKIIE